MRELSVKPELEVYGSGHIDLAMRLVDEGLLTEPLQFGIVLGVRGGMQASVDNLVHMVRTLRPDSVWQAIGISKANIRLAAVAIAMGGNARTGLEDNLYLRRGKLAWQRSTGRPYRRNRQRAGQHGRHHRRSRTPTRARQSRCLITNCRCQLVFCEH